MLEQQERLPTLFASGLFQVFTLVLLFIALLYGQRGLVLLALLILAMFNGAFLWSRFSLSGLTSDLTLSRDRVFPGEPLILEAAAINNKLLPVWLQLAVAVDHLLLSPSPALPAQILPGMPGSTPGTAVEELPLPTREMLYGEGGLLWQQEARWQWQLQPCKRGVYSVGTLRLSAGDMFGFYKQGKNLPRTLSVIVYPRLVSLNRFSAPLQELFGAPGAKSPVVDPVYAVATRDYRESSPARYIHWKASARHRRLQEKVFEPSAQQKILLAVDVSLFHREKALQDFERTLEVVASLAVYLEQRGRAFGLASNGIMEGEKDLPASLQAASGSGQLLHLLEMLARLQNLPRESMEKVLLHGKGLMRGVTCLYFTYKLSPQINDRALDLLKQLQIPVILIEAAAAAQAAGPFGSGRAAMLPSFSAGRFYKLETLIGEEAALGER